jgi:hypothetical protein
VRFCSYIQRRLNDTQNAFDIAQDIVVPESKHAVAARLEKIGTHHINRHLIVKSMLSAIDFDHDAQFMTGEVCVVRSDRCLSAKV